MGLLIVITILSLIIGNFVYAILNIRKDDPYRLLWHLFICFPIIGPLVFLSVKGRLRKT